MASCPKCGKSKIKRKQGILRCRRCGSSDDISIKEKTPVEELES